MALIVDIPADSGGGAGSLSTALSRAQTLLGSTMTRVMGSELETNSWFVATPTGTGTVTLSSTDNSGVVTCASGGTAGGVARLRPVGLGVLLSNPTTSLWYFSSRSKLTTAIDAQAYVGIGIGDLSAGAPALFIGGIGSRSTTNFAYDILNNAGSAAANGSLGVALDTSYHQFEMWGNTSNLNIAMDGVVKVTIAIPASVTNPCLPQIFCTNNATAANRAIASDDIYLVTPSAT